MKKLKLLTILLLTTLCLTGCKEKNIKLDFEKINTEIENAKMDGLYVQGVQEEVEKEGESLLSDLESVYYINDIFDVDMAVAENAVIRMNKENYDLYIVVEPAQGQKETIQKAANQYFENLEEDTTISDTIQTKIKNRLEKEYKGVLIYIVSDNNEEIYNAIIKSQEPIFNTLVEVDNDLLNTTFGIDPADVEEYTGRLPLMNINVNMYLIIKPKQGKEQKIKDAMEEYIKAQEKTFELYSAGQIDIIRERKETKLGDYLIYILSKDNESIYNIIENNKISE